MKLTLIGLYNYDNTLFSGISLPETLDTDTLINSILMRGGEFEVTYPDPDVLKTCITAWSSKWQATFTRWVDALSIDYAPLENYDRHEHWTDDKDYTETNDDTTTNTGTDTSNVTSNSTATDDSTTTNTRSAYDTEGFSNHDKTVYDDDSSINSSQSTTIGINRSTVLDADKAGTDDLTHDGRVHGNIGVTTSQQMLQQELDIGYWNIYEHITDMFLREFTIPVYV